MTAKRRTAQWIADTCVDEIRQDLLKGDNDVAARRIAKALEEFAQEAAQEVYELGVIGRQKAFEEGCAEGAAQMRERAIKVAVKHHGCDYVNCSDAEIEKDIDAIIIADEREGVKS